MDAASTVNCVRVSLQRNRKPSTLFKNSKVAGNKNIEENKKTDLFLFYTDVASPQNEGGVIGVDMGDEFTKVALVSPGKPFEIVLNTHSKRKSMTAVSFAETARAFGDGAASSVARTPNATFLFTNSLLGVNISSEILTNSSVLEGINGLPQAFYPYHYVYNKDRGSVDVKINDNLTMTPEELTANFLGHVKSMAIHAERGDKPVRGEAIKLGGVITVPCSFTQRQRQALVDAAEIAGIEIMGLVHGPAAAAVHHSLDLSLNSNSSHISLIYDVGSRYIDAAIVKYSAVNLTDFGRQKEAYHVHMLACSSIDGSGGHFLDIALAERAAEEFKKKNNLDVRQHPRSMKKLLNQAMRTKIVLSASDSASFTVENLLQNKDLKTKFNRDHINEILTRSGISNKLKEPFENVLKQANITYADIQSVELLGAGWRVPRVQEELANILKPLPLGQHLNGDEAMAMGAAFIAANSSAAFRVRKVFLTDTSVFSYSVRLQEVGSESAREGEEPMNKLKELIGVGSRLYGTKTMVLKSRDDLDISLLENDNLICKYEIRGVFYACREQYKELDVPKVSLVFRISNSGIIKLENAYATFEETVVIPANSTADVSTAATNSSQSNLETNTTDNVGIPLATNNSMPVATEYSVNNSTSIPGNITKNETAQVDESQLKKKKKKYIVHLKINEIISKPFPLKAEQKNEGKRKLAEFEQIDLMVVRKANARNNLETYIYATRDNFGKELVKAVSTEEQREGILSYLADDEEWLYDKGWDASADTMENKLRAIEEKVEPILKRSSEYEMRDQVVRQMNETLRDASNKLADYKKYRTWISNEVIEAAQNATRAIELWWQKSIKEQNALPNTSDPVFTRQSVSNKLREVYGIIKAVEKIPKPRPTTPPPTTNITANGNTTSSTATPTSTNATSGDTSGFSPEHETPTPMPSTSSHEAEKMGETITSSTSASGEIPNVTEGSNEQSNTFSPAVESKDLRSEEL